MKEKSCKYQDLSKEYKKKCKGPCGWQFYSSLSVLMEQSWSDLKKKKMIRRTRNQIWNPNESIDKNQQDNNKEQRGDE